jgi:exopolysaccharide biosynthesis polyprenyl glycosylphosphotransferase
MFRRFSVNFALLSILLDGTLVVVALVVAAWVRPALNAFSFAQRLEGFVFMPLQLYVAFPLTWCLVLMLFSVYDGRRNLRVTDEFGSLTLASLLATIAMAGVLYLSYRNVSRLQFISFALLAYLGMLTWRSLARLGFRMQSSSGVQRRKVLVVGAGEGGRRLGEQITGHPYLGLSLAGFLDDDPTLQAGASPVLGGLAQLRTVVAQQAIDDVVIALPRSADQALNRLVAELHDLPVKVWIIPDYFSLALHRASVEEFANIPMLDLRAPALSEYQRMLKRGFDLLMCLGGLPFILPAMGLIALAIRLDSSGPVFYRCKRMGENGREFEMIKFRSMVANADDLRHLVEKTDAEGRILQHKIRSDPRVTRVGSFLRRTSLDELPQVFNVLSGAMSLVGPRPEQPHLVENYELWQRRRFAVPQGLTGWWQVNGRSDKPMHLNTEDDLYYVQHYSIWLDLQILAKTVWVVLRGKGAY